METEKLQIIRNRTSTFETTQLNSNVYRIILNHADNDTELKTWLEDLLKGGCKSGMVSELIYYDDTVKFFDDNEDDIIDLCTELTEEQGHTNLLSFLASLNGASNVGDFRQLKNLLSWLAFEEISHRIYGELFEGEE
jgi:hypothetical protein